MELLRKVGQEAAKWEGQHRLLCEQRQSVLLDHSLTPNAWLG